MNQLALLKCPNCGAGLGQPSGTDYLCAYCGHRSRQLATRAGADQQAVLAAVLARFAEQRQQRSREGENVLKRQRDAFLAKRNENGIVMYGIGTLFLLIGVGLAGAITASSLSAATFSPPPLGAILFAVFWLVSGAGGIYIGVRYRRAGVREKRLRATGIAGRAEVASYKDSRIVVDGNPKVELVLNIELPGRAPYAIKHADYVPRIQLVTDGAELPVFVNPQNPSDVLVDWWEL